MGKDEQEDPEDEDDHENATEDDLDDAGASARE